LRRQNDKIIGIGLEVILRSSKTMRGEEYDNIATKLFDTICIIDGGFMDAGI
jgi:hypothetical protein